MSVTKVTDAMRNVTAVDATKISGAVPSASLTNVDLSKLEYNQAILAFKVASANQLAKFQMVDQVIDEYQDATGIDAGASTNELAGGATTAKYYEGASSTTPTTSSVGSVASTGTVDGDYTYYKWTTVATDHTFTTDTAQDYEYLVVAGGGGGGNDSSHAWGSGGGGAGGFRTATGFAVAATTITGITVGAGGALSAAGANSVFSSITSTGGGVGAQGNNVAGGAGGSGGGGTGGNGGGGAGGSASPSGQGNNGGAGASTASHQSGGGGGGAGAVGEGNDDKTNTGGIGLASSITGSPVYYAGGGGAGAASGSADPVNAGGNGGGGAGGSRTAGTAAVAGSANLGGGGGGGGHTAAGAAGGSGIVIIRRPTSISTSGANLTLQSVATTAESAPTTADLVMLIEDNGSGTATINTDIKAKVSRDGTDFGDSYVTLVDEGDWGTDKRILVARNIDLTASHDTGTAMKYKIETFNQSAGVKETRIHATSLAWA
jgi:hypothetical protein